MVGLLIVLTMVLSLFYLAMLALGGYLLFRMVIHLGPAWLREQPKAFTGIEDRPDWKGRMT